MKSVGIHDARTGLSHLVDKAAAREDVIISRNGKPLVRITALTSGKPRIKFGALKGKLRIPGDFDAPLPDEVPARFTGR